jgi:hypothetical protein
VWWIHDPTPGGWWLGFGGLDPIVNPHGHGFRLTKSPGAYDPQDASFRFRDSTVALLESELRSHLLNQELARTFAWGFFDAYPRVFTGDSRCVSAETDAGALLHAVPVADGRPSKRTLCREKAPSPDLQLSWPDDAPPERRCGACARAPGSTQR